MFQSIVDDLKREFSNGTVLHRLIIINVLAFVFINVVKFVLRIKGAGELDPLYYDILHFFSISSDWVHNLKHPWVILTSMFLHEGFWHILWNMLFLYWFGRIVADLVGNAKILPLYLLGGLVGGFVFWATAQFIPYGGGREVFALGASAGVMAIVVASGMIAPDYNLRLLLLGDVKLKYVVAALVFLDLVGIANYENTGGHFAHLGGAFFGGLFVRQLQQGNDWSVGVHNVINWFRSLLVREQVLVKKPRETTMVVKRFYKKEDPSAEVSHQERLDAILDKISKSGYASLTQEEIDFLEDASSR